MSAPPIFVGQSPQWKYRLRPSFEMDGAWSMNGVLTGGPRLTGGDQAEKRGGASAAVSEASSPGTTAEGVPGGSARQPAASRATRPREDRVAKGRGVTGPAF